MPKAYVDIKDTPHYRKTSFINGFARLGFMVVQGHPQGPMASGDVFLTWNKMARSASSIARAKEAGAAVIIAENGYYGRDAEGNQTYALALDGHNGSGRWYVGDDDRLKTLGIEFQPWKQASTGRILVAEQRGIGSPLMRSPPDFTHRANTFITAQGKQPYVRLHPGRHEPARTLAQDLEDKDALVVWSSNAATEALIAGVPVHFMAPSIVTRGAAKRLTTPFLWNSDRDTRPEAFQRLAWAQWFLHEIASGEALRVLIDVQQGKLPSVQEGFGV